LLLDHHHPSYKAPIEFGCPHRPATPAERGTPCAPKNCTPTIPSITNGGTRLHRCENRRTRSKGFNAASTRAPLPPPASVRHPQCPRFDSRPSSLFPSFPSRFYLFFLPHSGFSPPRPLDPRLPPESRRQHLAPGGASLVAPPRRWEGSSSPSPSPPAAPPGPISSADLTLEGRAG